MCPKISLITGPYVPIGSSMSLAKRDFLPTLNLIAMVVANFKLQPAFDLQYAGEVVNPLPELFREGWVA